MIITLKLPWPPVTANQYWKVWRNRAVLNPKAKAYRDEVYYRFRTDAGYGNARIAVVIYVTAPTRHKLDLDNMCKIPLDCLMHANWMHDDSQIDQLTVIRLQSDKNDPHLLVQISEIEIDGDTGDEPQSRG